MHHLRLYITITSKYLETADHLYECTLDTDALQCKQGKTRIITARKAVNTRMTTFQRCIIIESKETPPNESRSSLVSLESLTGTCELPSASALMHFPSAVSDRLIDLASSREDPPTPEKRPNLVDTWALGFELSRTLN